MLPREPEFSPHSILCTLSHQAVVMKQAGVSRQQRLPTSVANIPTFATPLSRRPQKG